MFIYKIDADFYKKIKGVMTTITLSAPLQFPTPFLFHVVYHSA